MEDRPRDKRGQKVLREYNNTLYEQLYITDDLILVMVTKVIIRYN